LEGDCEEDRDNYHPHVEHRSLPKLNLLYDSENGHLFFGFPVDERLLALVEQSDCLCDLETNVKEHDVDQLVDGVGQDEVERVAEGPRVSCLAYDSLRGGRKKHECHRYYHVHFHHLSDFRVLGQEA